MVNIGAGRVPSGLGLAGPKSLVPFSGALRFQFKPCLNTCGLEGIFSHDYINYIGTMMEHN